MAKKLPTTYKTLIVRPIILSLFIAYLFLPSSIALANDVVSVIDKNAWKIDFATSSPVPGHEKEFEKVRESASSLIEVFWVTGKRVTVFVFKEDGFLLLTHRTTLERGKNEEFTLTYTLLDYSRGIDDLREYKENRKYKIKDSDTLVQSRDMGTFTYKRVPDFNPPPDPLTDLNPLPWKDYLKK